MLLYIVFFPPNIDYLIYDVDFAADMLTWTVVSSVVVIITVYSRTSDRAMTCT